MARKIKFQKRVKAIRAKHGFVCKASRYSDMEFIIYERDAKAVASLESVLEILKEDLVPSKAPEPQRIGSLEEEAIFTDQYFIRSPVSDFAPYAEKAHIVSLGCKIPVISSINTGKRHALELVELKQFDTKGRIEREFESARDTEKGKILETPIFLWLKKHIEKRDIKKQVNLEEDKNIYANYNYRVLSASVDRVITVAGKKGCLEIKCTSDSLQDCGFCAVEEGQNSLHMNPKHPYWKQIQACLHIMNMDFGMLFAYSWKNQEYACIYVAKDTGRFDEMYRNFLYDQFLPRFLNKVFRSEEEEQAEIEFIFLEKEQLGIQLEASLCKEIIDLKKLYLQGKRRLGPNRRPAIYKQ